MTLVFLPGNATYSAAHIDLPAISRGSGNYENRASLVSDKHPKGRRERKKEITASEEALCIDVARAVSYILVVRVRTRILQRPDVDLRLEKVRDSICGI